MHAADEPTAVWDEQSLRAAGLTDLLSKRPSEPPAPPATPGSAVPSDPSIVVERLDLPPQQHLSPQPERPSRPSVPAAEGGFGWIATVAVAVVLGAVVYVLIRLARG